MTTAYLGVERPTVEIKRLIDAPRSRVFEAFTQTHHLEQWWGPDGFTIQTTKWEFKVGGQWEFTMHHDERGDFPNVITWDEIVEDQTIRFHHGSSGDDHPADFTTTISFSDEDGHTSVHFVMLFSSEKAREETIAFAGALEGLTQTINHLEAYVKGENNG